ncbi:PAS domain-containing sensor histidine kinase [Segetibacter koreensis]|uniref:PAS domain-containing sensor histidine kinase n=1 Tax=Segetibacter koreensis TaxID=398037 RepID=UPI00036A8896|nr:ATP-binding protein [Segetibacter koreensis]
MSGVHENLLIHAPCGIFSFTEDGVITMANAYCCKLLEYEEGELTGRNFSELLTVSGKVFYQTHFYPLVKLLGHTEEIFMNLQAKSKNDVPVVVNAIIAKANGKSEILCSFIPILNRVKYEEEILLAKKNAEEALRKNEVLEKVKLELEQQQKVLDKQITLLTFQNKELLQLSDIITHDLQEPVRKLILFSTELQQKEMQATFDGHALSVIKKSSQKIKTLLLNLQNYLALTAVTATKEQVNLSHVVQYELGQLQNAYPQINVHAEVEPLPTITGNKNQLNWMFHHLLKNAFDHGCVDNRLMLTIQSVVVKENLYNHLEDKYKYIDYVKITISDEGPGFESEFNDYIFGVLKKLNVAGETVGFGLAFCKRIVENHFGNIRAEGLAGKGAAFTVMLPIDNV